MMGPNAWNIVRRWWWLLLLVALGGAANAVVLSNLMTPTYQTTATILVSQQPDEGTVQREDLETSALIADTFTQLITVRPVLERAAIDLPGLSAPEIAGSLEVTQAEGSSQLINVTASHSEPEVARDIANVVSGVFIASPEVSLGQAATSVSIIEQAQAPTTPESPNRELNAMLGALLGFTVALGLISLYEYFDRSLTRPEQVLSLAGLPTLGRLPDEGGAWRAAEGPALAQDATSRIAEEYRSVRSNLKRALLPDDSDRLRRRVVAIASPGEGEGKTTTLANLAVVFGLAGYRTLVIDADLRQPALHDVFATKNREGLTTLLTGNRPDLSRAIQRTSHPGVSLLPSGPLALLGRNAASSNPADLLGSARMRTFIRDLRAEFDLVLIDTPPALEASDASMVAEAADALVMVVRSARTGADELLAAVDRLASTESPIVGVVFNRVRSGHRVSAYGAGPMRPTVVSLPAPRTATRHQGPVQPASLEEPRSGA